MSVLDQWNPTRLLKSKPWIVAFQGGRRQGKSLMQNYLCKFYRDEFDLVVSFCGSVSCSPELVRTFQEYFDARFMFEKISIRFLETLRTQQEILKSNNTPRNVLLLFDDLEMTSEEYTQLGFFATRARHFNCSMFFCSVAYVSIPKSYRRSLDCLFLFSVPMSSDKKILLQEFSRNPNFADFCISQLKKYEALVLDCSAHKQELFTFKIPEETECQSDNPVSISEISENTIQVEKLGTNNPGLEQRVLDTNIEDKQQPPKSEVLIV